MLVIKGTPKVLQTGSNPRIIRGALFLLEKFPKLQAKGSRRRNTSENINFASSRQFCFDPPQQWQIDSCKGF